MSWYFYNSSYDIDDPSTSGLTLLDTASPPGGFILSSSFTLVSPNKAWKPFSPADQALIAQSSPQPCAVGHKRLLFYVEGDKLKPIYWELQSEVPVHSADWVFSSTLTPIDPSWSEVLANLWDLVRPDTDAYRSIFESSIRNGCIEQICASIAIDPKHSGRVVFVPGSKPEARILSLYQATTAKFVKEWHKREAQTIGICKFDYGAYKKMYKVEDRPGDAVDYKPPRVDKLTLVIHGIGQKLTVPTEKRNFTFAVEKIRTRVQEELKAAGRNETHLMLPVIWRHAFKVENAQFTPESIRPPFMAEFRDKFNDFMYDVPYYMSSHKELMISAAMRECNRVFDLFKVQHPYFGDTVDFIGHSLGSVIAADILSVQPSKTAHQSSMLHFNVANFICCGSPLGFFLYLRSVHLVPRSLWPADTPLPEFGCLAVEQVYNVIHPYDIVASLLSPTVRGGSQGLELAQVPKEYGRRRSLSALDKLASRFVAPRQSQAYPASEDMLALNKNGQLDWVLPSTSRFEIVGALTAHTSYWVNSDFARMLVHIGEREEFKAKMDGGATPHTPKETPKETPEVTPKVTPTGSPGGTPKRTSPKPTP